MKKHRMLAAVLCVLGMTCVPVFAYAATAREIDTSVDVALESFQKTIPDGNQLLKEAKGVLVFPGLIRGGIGWGAEYGEGALRIGGKTAAYYRAIGGSLGIQLGGQSRKVVVLFMEESNLKKFQAASGWKGALDASGVFLETGGEAFVDTVEGRNKPVMAFVLDQRGLMFNLTAEVAKISKIQKS
jgi:lipid-binding SYLF domain-containing protein